MEYCQPRTFLHPVVSRDFIGGWSHGQAWPLMWLTLATCPSGGQADTTGPKAPTINHTVNIDLLHVGSASCQLPTFLREVLDDNFLVTLLIKVLFTDIFHATYSFLSSLRSWIANQPDHSPYIMTLVLICSIIFIQVEFILWEKSKVFHLKIKLKLGQNKLACTVFIIFLCVYTLNKDKCCLRNAAGEKPCSRFQSTDTWGHRK